MTTMEGPLSKWTNVMKGWQYRWFVLDDNAGLLSYYTSKEKMMRGARRGCVRLKGAVIGIDDEDDSTFTITVDQKIFHFQARDADERERWIRALEDTILRHAQPSRMTWEAMCIGCRRRAQMQKWDSRPSPSLGDLNKKLTETDTYLQMLIDQVKKIEQKIEKIEDGSLKDKSNDVKISANLLLESIKHSIVLLQIAKNTAHPINGIFQPNLESAPDDAATAKIEEAEKFSNVSNVCHLDLAITKNVGSTTLNSGVLITGSFDDSLAASTPDSMSQTLSNLSSSHDDLVPGSEVVINHLGLAPLPTQITQHMMIVPEVSYSSSEDDENFYDANDYEGSPTHQSRSTSIPLSIHDASEGIMPCRRESESKQLMAQVDPSNIDYDVLYEDDDEDELESLEQHGSIISHLLSQAKLGMDLTKVVLPTFILERRSLLEMYADFFAHPDLFCSIVDFADPKDRMIQVVRWYLSAFHAGRKSTVAKKPYNPILGEIFRCRYNWDSPELNNKEENSELVTDGPVPWATKNDLAFISEQVSHHPPISAFYAEHYNKRISLDAHIWTKSKFLGLSIGVHMIGQGCISILDYEEEYIISFPNGYGRSILTVPWVELGGKVNLTCAKTGYYANIDFVTKPFYGGKKHRISAEIFAPNEKKSFVIITGEWNGIMVAKYDTGMTEVFVDTRNTPIIKKIVQPVTQQEEYESRRLWKDVTLNLKVRDVEKATAVKYSLEQRQREEAKERLEKKVKWDTRYFHEVGEHWIFDRPLLKRHSWTIASKQS